MEIRSGNTVEIRLSGGKTNHVRVVEVAKGTVYVTSERLYIEAAKSGRKPEILIGVQRKDIITP